MAHNYENGINYINGTDGVGADYQLANEAVKHASRYAVDNTKAYSVEDILGYKYASEEKSGSAAKTVMDNFDEFIKDREAKRKQEEYDEALRDRQEKENAREIARNLSSEEIAKLKLMGVDVEGAALSDIMGMVNTMRGREHRDEQAELLAKISISAGDTSDINMVGGNVKLAGSNVDIDGVSVADVISDKITKDTANKTDTPEPDETVQAASNEALDREGFVVSNNELMYIMKNDLELTNENMYKAHYSGSKVSEESLPPKVFKKMMKQIEKAIELAGYDVTDETVNGAKLLINNDVPLTPKTVIMYMEYQDMLGKDIRECGLPEGNEELIRQKAKKLQDSVCRIDPRSVYDMVLEDKTPTIASAAAYDEKHIGRHYDQYKTDNLEELSDHEFEKELAAIRAMRQMEEIRLSMTQEAAYRLVKSDLYIDTRELSKVVAELRSMEDAMIEYALRGAGVSDTQDSVDVYKEVVDGIEGLSKLPMETLAAPLLEGDDRNPFTIRGLYAAADRIKQLEYNSNEVDVNKRSETDSGRGSNQTAQGTYIKSSTFETVRKSYEAVGTAPRRDMGDSISKAFANVDDIIESLDMEITEDSRRAVKILAFNTLPINRQSIEQVMEYDRQVNELMDSFYPEAVLSMIKDGINPMDAPIEELNKQIRARNYNAGVTDAENFAAYLRSVEKQGNITKEERESYIGIYRVMDKLAKSGDREVGYLFANGGRLTVRNLISAMRSSRAKGFDIAVDEEFGMLEELNQSGNRIDEQIEKAFMSNASYEESESGDELEEVKESIDARLDDLTEAVSSFLADNNIEETLLNASAVNMMLTSDSGLYGLVSDILARLKFDTNAKEDMVDEETGNMAASLDGEDIPYEFTPDSILKSLVGSSKMSLKYDDLRENLTEMLINAGVKGNVSKADIAAIKTVQAGFNILGRMAADDKYHVPVNTAKGVKVMNLTIRHDDMNRGSILISLKDETYGHITANLRMLPDGELTGELISDSSDGNYKLMEASKELFSCLANEDVKVADIQVGRSNRSDYGAGGMQASTMTDNEYALAIYKSSVAFVKAIGQILR